MIIKIHNGAIFNIPEPVNSGWFCTAKVNGYLLISPIAELLNADFQNFESQSNIMIRPGQNQVLILTQPGSLMCDIDCMAPVTISHSNLLYKVSVRIK